MLKGTWRVAITLLMIILCTPFRVPILYHNNSYSYRQEDRGNFPPKNASSSIDRNLDILGLKNDANSKLLDFKKLRGYILDNLMTRFGGFPLETKGDGYINATYFGAVTLYVLGGLDIDKTHNITSWLDYSYDEETGGFRNWLGDEPSLVGTLWGLLLANDVGLKPTDFNLNTTLEFIDKYLNETYVSHLDLITSALLLHVLSVYRSSINASCYEDIFCILTDTLFSYFDDSIGLFVDGSIKLSPIYQTYICIRALASYNSTLIHDSLATQIIYSLMERFYVNDTNESYCGFGWNTSNPSVLETGLAADILVWLSKRTQTNNFRELIHSDKFWYNLTSFINQSQASNGGIKRNPDSDEVNIFHAFGAIVAYIACNRIQKLSKITTTIKPEEQIAVDYNATVKATVRVEVFNQRISKLKTFFILTNTITASNNSINGTMQENNSEYTIVISDVTNLTFGNYYLNVSLWNNLTLNSLLFEAHINFRVGYKIATSIKPATARPGENITISIDVTFDNGTYANNSQLIIIVGGPPNITIINATYNLNGSTLNLSYKLPGNISLGQYRISMTVNDSHGFNHTFAYILMFVSDHINFDLGKYRSEYYVGEEIIVTLTNLTYNYSKSPIPTTANLSAMLYYSNGTMFKKGNASWAKNENLVNVNICIQIPPVIPHDNNITIKFEIQWDETTMGTKTYTLFNATIKVHKFFIHNLSILRFDNTSISPTSVYIGEKYRFMFSIIHAANISSKPIDKFVSCYIYNATVNVTITDPNTTWFSGKFKFDVNTSMYSGEIYIDPNMPIGDYNFTIWILINYNGSWANASLEIPIRGDISITNLKFPHAAITGEFYYANFSLICNETQKSLANVSLFANVTFINYTDNTTENISIIAPITSHNTTYYLSFKVEQADRIRIDILRTTNNQSLLTLIIDTISPAHKKRIYVRPLSVLIPVVVIVYICYILVRWKYSRLISRRFLVERAKKFGQK